MSRYSTCCLLAIASLCSVPQSECAAQPLNFFFDGTIGPIDQEFTNPYSGETFRYTNSQANVNNTVYTGSIGNDSLDMTNFGDVLSIRGESGSQVVTSIEIFFGGQGDDFLHLADNDFRLNNINAFGSSGNDIIWTNSGNDVLLGEAGNDHLVGGPGNDDLHGGDDDDYLSGGAGDDTLRGGLGSDLLVGGPGSDDYYLLKPRRDISETTIIQESPDGAIDRLIFTSMLQNQFGLVFLRPDDFRFERLGRDLLIIAENEDWAVNALVEGQFSAVGAGLDSVDFISDFSNPRTSVVESIDLRAMFVPEPSTLTLAFAVVGAGAYVRRCRGASIRRGA